MYVAGVAHPHRAPSLRFLERVGSGAVEACTNTEVLQEILYRYSALGRLNDARKVYDLFVEICPVVLDVTLADTDRARDILCGSRGLSARDCIHAAVMLNNSITSIATFDKGFDHIPGIRRIRLPS
jgi:predicted nucleic acid-binding protein